MTKEQETNGTAAAQDTGDIKLRKEDLTKSWLRWVTFGQAGYNYERMQGLGFCHSMKPVIERLYPNDKQARSSAMKRHLTYYNTENNWGAAIAGIAASMEEEKAGDPTITDEAINGVKMALMGPLAGIGDTVTQSLVKTILLGIGCSLAMGGSILGPILFLVGMSIYTLGLSRQAYLLGYKSGKSSVTNILRSGAIKRVTEALGVLGIMVLGAMVASNIGLGTPFNAMVGGMEINLQSILDSILPKMIPLAAFLITYKFVIKGVKLTVIIAAMFIAGIAGSLVGLLG